MSDFQLTPEQEKQIRDIWNRSLPSPPSIPALVHTIFGRAFDNRSPQHKAVKAFIASCNMKSEVSVEKPESLSEEYQTYIRNNYQHMNAVEMARILHKNPLLSPRSPEVSIIQAFVKNLPLVDRFGAPPEPPPKYIPPKSVKETIERINEYIPVRLNIKELSAKQKKDMEATLGFLSTYRFIHTMNLFPEEDNRKLFESVFIAYVYDKHDLTPEEVDAYINLALDVANLSLTQQRINSLTTLLRNAAANAENDDSPRISKGLADALHYEQGEYDANKKRQKALVTDLQGRRVERTNASIRDATVLNLVGEWKEEESRNQLLSYGKLLEQQTASKINDFSMDEFFSKISGISKEEALYGR